MRIYFKTKKLQKTCNEPNEAQKVFGRTAANKLQQRLMELQAADCLEDISRVPPARCHQLIGDRAGQLSVDLIHPRRLLFIAANDPIPKLDDGGLDWARVTEIEIIGIVDTH